MAVEGAPVDLVVEAGLGHVLAAPEEVALVGSAATAARSWPNARMVSSSSGNSRHRPGEHGERVTGGTERDLFRLRTRWNKPAGVQGAKGAGKQALMRYNGHRWERLPRKGPRRRGTCHAFSSQGEWRYGGVRTQRRGQRAGLPTPGLVGAVGAAEGASP